VSIDARFEPGWSGRDAFMELRLTGGQDIFRFAINMLDDQVEFCEAGRSMLVQLREDLTPARFDPMARSMLGAERHEKLRSYFERDQFCAACEVHFVSGDKYARIEAAKALCSACAPAHLFLFEVTR